MVQVLTSAAGRSSHRRFVPSAAAYRESSTCSTQLGNIRAIEKETPAVERKMATVPGTWTPSVPRLLPSLSGLEVLVGARPTLDPWKRRDHVCLALQHWLEQQETLHTRVQTQMANLDEPPVRFRDPTSPFFLRFTCHRASLQSSSEN